MVHSAHLHFLLSFVCSTSRQVEPLSIWASRSGPFQFYNFSYFVLKLQFPFPGLLSSSTGIPSCHGQAYHFLMLSLSLAKHPLSGQHLMSSTERQHDNISELGETFQDLWFSTFMSERRTLRWRGEGRLPETIQPFGAKIHQELCFLDPSSPCPSLFFILLQHFNFDMKLRQNIFSGVKILSP